MANVKQKSKITQSRTIFTTQWKDGYEYVARLGMRLKNHETFGSLVLLFIKIGRSISHSYGANSHDLL